MLHIRFFGTPIIKVDDQSLKKIAHSPKLLELFGFLVMRRHQPHSREILATMLWPDLSGTRARRNLNNALWEIKNAPEGASSLGKYLWSDSQTIQFAPTPEFWLDVMEFETATTAFRRKLRVNTSVTHEALLHLERAVELYQGEFLESLYADWCLHLREQLREEYLTALETLIHMYRANRRPETALPVAQKLLQADPFREEAHFQIVQLYSELKRPQEAYTQHQKYLAIWRDELQASPSPRMELLVNRLDIESGLSTAPRREAVLSQDIQLLNGVMKLLQQSQAPLTSPEASALRDQLWKQVATYGERIGRTLKAQSANSEALPYLALAIEALALLPPSIENYKNELALRCECDELYDLGADQEKQILNLQRASQLADLLSEPEARLDIWARQAWLARRLGNYSDALPSLEKMLALCHTISYPAQEALARRLLGIIYDELGDFRRALAEHTSALKIDETLKHRAGLYSDHINLASILTGMGYYSKALHHLKQASACASQPPPLIQVTLAGNMGNVWTKLGQFQLAESVMTPAMKLVRQTGDQETECWLGGRLASLYYRQHELERALRIAHHYYQRALTIQAPHRMTELADVLACVYYTLADGDNALAWASHVSELSEKHDLRRYRLRGWMRLAQAHLLLNQRELALPHIQQAISVFEKLDQPLEEEAELFWVLAQAHSNAEMQALSARNRAKEAIFTLANLIDESSLQQIFLETHLLPLTKMGSVQGESASERLADV